MSLLDNLTKKQRKTFKRIVAALVVFAIIMLLPIESLVPAPYALWVEFVLYLIPYLMAGYDVLLKAGRNIIHGNVFDENFLMSIATIGAFALVFFPDSEPHMAEGAAVMLFYQVGELFQNYAVGKSRKSISDMMDIAPDFAMVLRDGCEEEVDPSEVSVGETIVVRPGERIPLDGMLVEGESQLDTSALTGESMPRDVAIGGEIISGSINLTGLIKVETTKLYEDSTVSRILELVENASEKKARTENFITRFARYYTPVVVVVAVLLAVLPPLVMGYSWSDWIERGLIFLVVSCPCALVISVPLSFFGGIGGASRKGILVKGSSYLETLSKVTAIAFDKTGTLTNGTFEVSGVTPANGCGREELLSYAAHAESFSNHPIALSIQKAWNGVVDKSAIVDVSERAGAGITAVVGGKRVGVGNDKLMAELGVSFEPSNEIGTILYVVVDGMYCGSILISDTLKADSKEAIAALRNAGVSRTVMLTGDSEEVAQSVAGELALSEYHAKLLPGDKVSVVEQLLSECEAAGKKVAFVGDGINDAPVLMRADVGIAMGAMGSDAAIEAADIVLMDDNPLKIALSVAIARKTMRIVWENIVFALGVKVLILVLAALGIATMWLAVFGDVGVAVIAILNAMRAMRVK